MRTFFVACLTVGVAACSREKSSPPQSSSPSLQEEASAPAVASADVPASSAAAGTVPSSLDGFQGEIDLRVKENDPKSEPTAFALLVKDGKIRLDVPDAVSQAAVRMVGPKPYAIVDLPAKKLSVVSDDAKQVLLVDLAQIGAVPGMGGGSPARPARPRTPKNPAHVTPTGKFDTVAGRKCEEWDVATDHRESTLCLAEEDASFLHVPSSGLPSERLWLTQVFDGKHFPLRIVTYRKDGQTEASRVEVTGMEKKELSPSAFEYPASYRVTDMAQMFRGVMGMASGMPALPVLSPQ